jgi:hypothetical protein
VTTTEPLTAGLLRRLIAALGSPATPDEDGWYSMILPPDEVHGYSDGVQIYADNTVFCVDVFVEARFASASWRQVLMAVNEHNANRRWPQAWVILPTEEEPLVRVRCGSYLDCADGVFLEVLERLVQGAVAGADSLFTRLVVDEKIPVSAVQW